MKNLPLVGTVPAVPPVNPVRVRSSFPGLQVWRRGLARWWLAASRAVRAARAPRESLLDVEALGPHLRRDLNLHENAEGWMQADQAWRQHVHYREAQAWRTLF